MLPVDLATGAYRYPSSLQTASASIAALYCLFTTQLPYVILGKEAGRETIVTEAAPTLPTDRLRDTPSSDPSMTFFSLGMMWVWQCSPSSTKTQRRPIL